MGKVCTFGVEGGLGTYTPYRQIVNEWLQVVNGIKNGGGVSGQKKNII